MEYHYTTQQKHQTKGPMHRFSLLSMDDLDEDDTEGYEGKRDMST